MLATLLWTDIIGKVTTTPFAVLAYYHEVWVGGVSFTGILFISRRKWSSLVNRKQLVNVNTKKRIKISKLFALSNC